MQLSNLQLRIISSAVALVLILYTLQLKNTLYISSIVQVLFSVALIEWGQLCLLSPKRNIILFFIFTIFTALIKWYLPSPWIYTIGSVIWIISIVYMLIFAKKNWKFVPFYLQSLFGLVLISFSLLSALMLLHTNFNYIISALSLAWVVDIFGFFIGRKFGKHPLAPNISPKKSIEGACGSVLGVFIVALVWLVWLDPNYPASKSLYTTLWEHVSYYSILAVLALIVIAVTGDLFESALKRLAQVKDSGNLFPGHGGLLDRLDSLLPLMPFFMLIHQYLQ